MTTYETPVLHYKFENNWNDSGLAGQHLTQLGNVIFSDPGKIGVAAKGQGAFAPGVFGYSFDQAGVLQNTTYNGMDSNDPWSVAFWYRSDFEDYNDYVNVFQLYDWLAVGGADTGFRVEIYRWGFPYDFVQFKFRHSVVGGGGEHYFDYKIRGSDWHHVAMTYDGSAVTLYIDGVDVEDDYAVVLDLNGALYPGLEILGSTQEYPQPRIENYDYVDEIKFWDIELTAAEVLEDTYIPSTAVIPLPTVVTFSGDVGLTWDSDLLEADFTFANNDLVSDDGLRTAVLVSLFTDRRARDDDELPDTNLNDRRGWWGDKASSVDEEDEIGSRLWLLEREKTETEVVVRARQYTEEALQWMIDDGVAATVTVTAERAGTEGNDRLHLKVDIRKVDGTVFSEDFTVQWENMYD